MEDDILKTNLLAIAVTGLLLLVTGTALYIFRNQIAGNSRYILPIPPLGVAAYVFVFNMYRHYNTNLPLRTWDMVKEIVYSTALAAVFFGLFTVLFVIIIETVKG
jgi:hypothetical protein